MLNASLAVAEMRRLGEEAGVTRTLGARAVLCGHHVASSSGPQKRVCPRGVTCQACPVLLDLSCSSTVPVRARRAALP